MAEITRDKSGDTWTGYMYAVLMFAVSIFKSLSCNHHIQRTHIAGRRNWLALTAAIYKKVETYDVDYIKIILYSESS